MSTRPALTGLEVAFSCRNRVRGPTWGFRGLEPGLPNPTALIGMVSLP